MPNQPNSVMLPGRFLATGRVCGGPLGGTWPLRVPTVTLAARVCPGAGAGYMVDQT